MVHPLVWLWYTNWYTLSVAGAHNIGTPLSVAVVQSLQSKIIKTQLSGAKHFSLPSSSSPLPPVVNMRNSLASPPHIIVMSLGLGKWCILRLIRQYIILWHAIKCTERRRACERAAHVRAQGMGVYRACECPLNRTCECTGHVSMHGMRFYRACERTGHVSIQGVRAYMACERTGYVCV